MTKMVQRPTQLSLERDREMNKKIEKVFELDAFQRMVDNAEGSTLFSDLSSTSQFIN